MFVSVKLEALAGAMELVKYLNYDICQIIEKIKNSIVELPCRYSVPTFIGNSGNIISITSEYIRFFKSYTYNDMHMVIMYQYHEISEDEFELGFYTQPNGSNIQITKEDKFIDSQYIFDLVDQLEITPCRFKFSNNIHDLHGNDFPEQVHRVQLKEMCIHFLNDPNYAPSKKVKK